MIYVIQPRFLGVNIMLGEIGEIPVLFKSMIPSEQSFALDFSSAGLFSKIRFIPYYYVTYYVRYVT